MASSSLFLASTLSALVRSSSSSSLLPSCTCRSTSVMMKKTWISQARKSHYSTRPSEPTSTSAKATSSSLPQRKKMTIRTLQHMYMTGTPISMLTAYDYHSARYLEQAGIDICLVGDSLAMVACGYASTNEIGMDEMLYHCRAVARGAKLPFLIGDMPFGSHQASLEYGVSNAIRMIREGGMEAVKIEGGKDVLPLVTRLVDIGIPVMGHIGLMPQRQSALSGFRVQGKTAESALQITKDALALQEAGAFAVLIEALPSRVAESLVKDLRIPTIGIGASSACAGQVLVQTDMLGMTEKVPRFCKKYADLANDVPNALRAYNDEVKSRTFPEETTNTYDMPEEEWRRFAELRAELVKQR